MHTEDLLLGVRGGRLEVRDAASGRCVPAPEVAYARMSTPLLSTDREITLLRHLEGMGTVLLNPIDAVLACVNKFWQLQTLALALAGLPVPDTLTYAHGPLDRVLDAVRGPCVVKAVRGHRGQQVFLAEDTALLREVAGSLDQRVPYAFQHYVRHSHGRDLRVIVVDGRAVTAQVRAASDGGITSNLARGGTATLCPGLHPAAERLAERAARALGMVVSGVDLLFEPDGAFTVCEVNVNVAWRATMPTVAPAIADACRARLRAHPAPPGPHAGDATSRPGPPDRPREPRPPA
ncbi:RimK family alpha-L-glutamate ligase [Streptomyces sp. MST-110588]|uniref:RimK family alpha-L-glutamate ligase n=1 Tax=Streptomyces sp. MST-110588 TaxID=2833628 RepID=UPI001F5D5853|nr:RimK family alpha-L-glutamate ligase [Streptomyces sp. MST-110588]UNO42212.1 RimK family alpha-L-glutamate ligase [Streptomyces sp. MST-110588]